MYRNPDLVSNNVAVVTLPTAAVLGDYVNIICLPNGENPPPGEICYATGWGTLCMYFVGYTSKLVGRIV